MLPIPHRIALGLALALLATPGGSVAQPTVGGSTGTPTHQGAAPSGTPLVTTEQAIAQEYAKLIQDLKTQRKALADQIKALDQKIAALKQQASRIGKGGPGTGSSADAEASAQMKRVNAAIDATLQEKEKHRAQIAAIDQQIAKLEKQRDKALAELEQQKQKAIQEAQKRRATSAAPIR